VTTTRKYDQPPLHARREALDRIGEAVDMILRVSTGVDTVEVITNGVQLTTI